MSEQKLLKRKKKAELDGNKYGLADACVDLAEFYYEKQLYESAIDEYTIASGILKNQHGKELQYAVINRRIGEAFVHLKEYKKALDCQQVYLNIAKQQGDKLEQQRALATMGHIYLTRYADDDTDKASLNLAYKAFIKSLVICEELGNAINKYEHKDMMARLLGNLGVVLENLGDYDKGIDLLLRSIKLCKSHDLYEQLQRSHTCLASLYSSKGDYNNAIQQYNAAIETAARLKNKVALKYECLKNKADILIKLADFLGAKTVLMKALKLNHFSEDNDDVKHKLKVVAAMCYTEDSLLTTSDSDYKTKKQLYEKLGDGACFLNNFDIAIEYYKKMLEAAVSNSDSGVDLSPCYYSLAQTYHDTKQYDMAIMYYKKDYEVSAGNSKDMVKILLNMADCMETANKDIIDIEKIYDEARIHSKAMGDKNIESRVVLRHIILLRNNGHTSQANRLEKSLKDINIETETLSDNEIVSQEMGPSIGDDISIKDITDVSSDSDAEDGDINKPRATRRRSKAFVVKKNPKGETQLHTACISGNLELAKRLIDQGHPINIRDNCGWLPIHEACICGHLDIVETLIQKGAWIHDRGGKLCDGITPLHDAASNGHLEVIELLLDKGALATAKTNHGIMPLYMLRKWHEVNKLDTESSNLYDRVTLRLIQDMEKLGYNQNNTGTTKECDALVMENFESIPPVKKNKVTEKSKNVIGKLRRNLSCDIDMDKRHASSDSELSDDAVDTEMHMSSRLLIDENAKDQYKKVIENLRYPLREGNLEKKRKSTESFQSALIEPSDIDDNWLENDIPIKHKKPKTNAITNVTKHTNALIKHSSSHSLKSNSSGCELSESDFNCSELQSTLVDLYHENSSSGKTVPKMKKRQVSLIEQGFTRHRSFSPTNYSSSNINKDLQQVHQTNTTSSGRSSDRQIQMDQNYASSSQYVTNFFNSERTLSIDVRIDGKLYRVPVLASELNFRTIEWLASEAADRYSRKEGVKPTLELETKNGALLAEDDYLNILFNVGNLQAEEIEAKIVRWNLHSLSDRYTEACVNLGIESNSTVLKILQDTSTSLNLSAMGLGHANIMPLCKALNRQINLQYLDLSANFMRDDALHLLSLSLPSLDNLTVLDLRNNELTAQGLKSLADIFVQSHKSLVSNLISLDLSYNHLGDESLKSLAILTRYLKLHILNLVDVGFTHEIFDCISNRNVDLSLEYITNINVSYNKLNTQQLLAILLWVNPQICEELNISSNNVTEHGLLKDVTNWLKSRGVGALKLKTINLTRCKVTDCEVVEFFGLMPCLPNLKSVDLSYNEDLTSSTLCSILQHPLNIQLLGCINM